MKVVIDGIVYEPKSQTMDAEKGVRYLPGCEPQKGLTMEKLCIFCEHFVWSKASCWGMMEGGNAACRKGHYKDKSLVFPEDENDFRQIILRGTNCPDYTPHNVKVRG